MMCTAMKRIIPVLVFVALAFCTSPAFAAAEAKSGTLLVAFGTTMPSAMPALDAINASYEKAGKPIVWAYTSDIIRNKLAKRGKKVFSVNEAMNECARLGIKNLTIQSLHVAPAEEFMQLNRMIAKNLAKNPGRFDSVKLGHPLLESEKDLNEVVDAVLGALSSKRKPGEALVLMGHGNDRGPADLLMAATHAAFNAKDPLVYLATVEGANSFDRVLPLLKEKGVKHVWLQPFMIVAGDHANNDLAGSEDDSWASRLKAAGIATSANLKGLGELEGVRAVFLRHSADTTDDLVKGQKQD